MNDLKNKKLFLLDMDGTIYLGDRLFDDTVRFLQKIKDIGGKYLFLTNNSSRGADAYVKKLASLGISSNNEDFLTSTDATILYIKSKFPGRKFYCMGTDSFTKQISDSGIPVTTEPDDDAFGLLISNDTELSFKKLEDASRLLLRGVEYIATNPDWVCPTEFGSVPDCGSFAEMLSHINGRLPYFIGKPEPAMIELAMEKFGYTKEETLMVGDRVYTDIASGVRAGVDTVLVLSGEGVVADIDKYKVSPTYVMRDVGELCDRLENI